MEGKATSRGAAGVVMFVEEFEASVHFQNECSKLVGGFQNIGKAVPLMVVVKMNELRGVSAGVVAVALSGAEKERDLKLHVPAIPSNVLRDSADGSTEGGAGKGGGHGRASE